MAAREPKAGETLEVRYSEARPLSGVVVVQDPATTVVTLPTHPVILTGDGDDGDDDPDRNAGTTGTVIQMGARR